MIGGEQIGGASIGTYFIMLLLGLAWAAWPVAILTNFRGLRDRHLRGSLRDQERLRRLPPYRWSRTDRKSDRRFATFIQYLVAIVFLVAAAALVIVALWGLARRAIEG